MKNILITGGKGQLAACIKDIDNKIEDYHFIYVDIEDLDITRKNDIEVFFEKNKIAYCINCAAYTAVDKAESEANMAKKVNVNGAKNLAIICKSNNAKLIHISTDFVFDGKQTKPYTENDEERPLGVYGETKLLGEREIASVLKEHFILRTSWLYSEHGHNFLKTMLKLGQEQNFLKIVADQIGTPTYAKDLAEVIIRLIKSRNSSYGLYHYSNEGVSSWYDFAMAIFEQVSYEVKVTPVKTESYKTSAERPKFSVMDKSKIKNELTLTIPEWRNSLKQCLNNLKR